MVSITCSPFAHRLNTNIWLVANDGIETSKSKDFGEGMLPIERVDAAHLLLIGQELVMEVIPTNQ